MLNNGTTGTERVTWADHHERAEVEFACDHEGLTRPPIYTDSMRRPHARTQCSRCGDWQGVKLADLSPSDREKAPPFDGELQQAWGMKKYEFARDLFQAERQTARTESLDTFRNEHAEFIDSPEWAEMRRLVLKRANGTCEGCLRRPAVQVHHMNYSRRFGREMMFDLRAVCRKCHEAIHNPDDLRNP